MPRIFLLALLALLVFPSGVAAQEQPGWLLRSNSSSSVYYHADDGRYVFPDVSTYASWFPSFTGVTTVSESALAAIPLRGIVTYRPGTYLVKITTDPKVYAVDANATLRWLPTEEVAATLYGADWQRKLVDVPDALFVNYRIGEPVSGAAAHDPATLMASAASVHVGLGLADAPPAPRAQTTFAPPATSTASGADLLPDLVPFAPYDLTYSTLNGRTILKFTATLWNSGKAALEIGTDPKVSAGDGDQVATQRIFTQGGGYRDVEIGTLFWHAVHAHYHYNEFGAYELELVKPATGNLTLPVMAQKTTFCLRDDTPVRAPAESPRASKRYNGCLGFRQGISVGWADIYPYTLPDQYFDVTDLPAGTYKMTFRVDPTKTIYESRRDNNEASALVELNPAARSFKVLGELSPFAASTNTLPDGTYIAVEDTSEIYVMYANRKRRVLSAPTSETYSWPTVAVAAIPSIRFVRAGGSADVFMVNDDGWRRRIGSLEVLQSYGTDAIIAPVTAEELAAYPSTDFVMTSAGQVYSVSERRLVGKFGALPSEVPPRSVQVINDRDFAAYGFPVAP